MYNSVKAWCDAEYKCVSNKPKKVPQSQLEYSGLYIWNVAKGSLADELGISAGDYILSVNGKSPDVDIIFNARRKCRLIGQYTFEIYTPRTEMVKKIKSKFWIFGIQYRQSPKEFSRGLKLSDPDLEEFEIYWKEGNYEALASFLPAFEILNFRYVHLDGSPYLRSDYLTVKDDAPLATDISYSNFSYMALSAASAKKIKRARYILDVIYKRHSESDSGFACIRSSILAVTESLISEAAGDIDSAIAWTQTAIERAWEIEENYYRLEQLTGHNVTIPNSAYRDTKIRYDLYPKGKDGGNLTAEEKVSLIDQCGRLNPGQHIVVTLLGEYRSNYYYYFSCVNCAVIFDKLRNLFPEIHVVSGGTYAVDPIYLRAEMPLKMLGVKFKVLNDEDRKIADMMDLERAPTNLSLNHKGEIVAEGALYDEALIWKTLSHHI